MRHRGSGVEVHNILNIHFSIKVKPRNESIKVAKQSKSEVLAVTINREIRNQIMKNCHRENLVGFVSFSGSNLRY